MICESVLDILDSIETLKKESNSFKSYIIQSKNTRSVILNIALHILYCNISENKLIARTHTKIKIF